MSAPSSWAFSVSSTACLAVSVLDITCTSASVLPHLRASSIATRATSLSSSVVSDQNSAIPPVSQMPSVGHSHQAVPNQRAQRRVVDVIAVEQPQNGVKSELAVAAEVLRCPVLGLFAGDNCGHNRLLLNGCRREFSAR